MEQKDNSHRQWAQGKKASMKRRCEEKDYTERGLYMVTLAIEGRQSLLGQLAGDPGKMEGEQAPHIVLSALGEAVRDEWQGIPRYYPEIEPLKLCIMPDHIHGILFVKEKIERHLGHVINGFKTGTRRAARLLGALTAAPVQYAEAQPQQNHPKHAPHGTLWEPGYNDRILHNYSTLEKWKAYLRDNPKRLAIRRLHPEYFRVRFGITIGQQTYAAIGNRFLLSYPEKKQIQLSRSLTDEAIAKEVSDNLTLARNGTILVSPAISKGEGTVMRAALEAKLPLIFLTPWGFNTFSKPGHQYYEACASGRFLILAPWPHQNERIPLTRQMCLDLNRMTKEICETDKYE